jgi:hypothetical protein
VAAEVYVSLFAADCKLVIEQTRVYAFDISRTKVFGLTLKKRVFGVKGKKVGNICVAKQQ